MSRLDVTGVEDCGCPVRRVFTSPQDDGSIDPGLPEDLLSGHPLAFRHTAPLPTQVQRDTERKCATVSHPAFADETAKRQCVGIVCDL